MKTNYRKLLCLAVTVLSAASCLAGGFMNTAAPRKLFNFGVRFGLNTTNRTVNNDVFNRWNLNSWGIGIDAGAVFDINFRDYLTIQPGFFYENRCGKYAYAFNYINDLGDNDVMTQFGNVRTHSFVVPVMVGLHFNISSAVRWNVEVGPYLQFILKNSRGDGFKYADGDVAAVTPAAEGGSTPAVNQTHMRVAHASNFDFGLKVGTSFSVLRHYYIGVHYMAGWLDAWKEPELGGRNKGWVFSIGYDF